MTRILVVDDDPAIRGLVSTVLGMDGEYEVAVVEDGEQAIALLDDEGSPTPDLVVLDVMMPGVDGFEVLSWIRDHEWLYDLPVIMLTARDTAEDEATGWHRGCDAYVPKPFDIEDLETKVADVLIAGPELRIARRRQRLTELFEEVGVPEA